MAQPVNLNELMNEMLKTADGTGENSLIYQSGMFALKEGKYQDAIKSFSEELIKIQEKYGKSKFPLEPKLNRLIATAYLNLNDPQHAGENVQTAVQMYKSLKF